MAANLLNLFHSIYTTFSRYILVKLAANLSNLFHSVYTTFSRYILVKLSADLWQSHLEPISFSLYNI